MKYIINGIRPRVMTIFLVLVQCVLNRAIRRGCPNQVGLFKSLNFWMRSQNWFPSCNIQRKRSIFRFIILILVSLLVLVILSVTWSYVIKVVPDRKAPIDSFDWFQLSCVIFLVYYVEINALCRTSFETGVSLRISVMMSSEQSRQSSSEKSQHMFDIYKRYSRFCW